MSSSSFSKTSYSESTQSLVSMKTSSKDYSRALAELSTSYGFGVAPMLPQAASSRSTSFEKKRLAKTQSAEPSASAKDFSSALASLQTSYGFQGAPVLPSSSR